VVVVVFPLAAKNARIQIRTEELKVRRKKLEAILRRKFLPLFKGAWKANF